MPDLYNDANGKETLKALLLEEAQLRNKLNETEEKWLAAQASYDNLDGEYRKQE